MDNKLTMGIIGALIISTSFYGGIKYNQGQNTASVADVNSGSIQRGGMRGGGRGMRGGGGFLSGEVLSVDDKSITLKLKDGGSKIIFVSDSTTITKSDAGTLNDMSVGKQVSVMGTTNPDGSVTGESIQIRPTLKANK